MSKAREFLEMELLSQDLRREAAAVEDHLNKFYDRWHLVFNDEELDAITSALKILRNLQKVDLLVKPQR